MDKEASKKPEKTVGALKAPEKKEKKEKKKKKSFRARMAAKKLEWIVFFLVTTLTIVILWPFCTMTVQAGHVGVYFSRFFGGTVFNKPYGEGLHFLFPWDAIIQYDRRLQSQEYSVVALTRGGLNVTVDMAVLWFVEPDDAADLHVSAGPDYRERVIDPAVVSTVRSVIGNYELNRLYDDNPLNLQNDVMNLLMDTLVDAPFTIHSILIREVQLPPIMADAISDKFVAEQNVLEERYRVLQSVETFKRTYVEAEATRLAQSIVNEGMSEAYLRYMGIQATLALSESPNAKLVIIGDKDGMPLILNPDTLDVSLTLPDGLAQEDYIPEGQEGARMSELLDVFDRILNNIILMDGVLGELVTIFPEADEGLRDTLPQEGQVPIAPGETDNRAPNFELP